MFWCGGGIRCELCCVYSSRLWLIRFARSKPREVYFDLESFQVRWNQREGSAVLVCHVLREAATDDEGELGLHTLSFQ